MVDSQRSSDWVDFLADNADFDAEFDPIVTNPLSTSSANDPFTTSNNNETCIAELLLDKLEQTEPNIVGPVKKSPSPKPTAQSFYSVFSQISQLADQYKSRDDESASDALLKVNQSNLGNSVQSINLLHSESSYELALKSNKLEPFDGRRCSTVLDEDIGFIALEPLTALNLSQDESRDQSWFVFVRTPIPPLRGDQSRSWLKAFVKFVPSQQTLQIFPASSEDKMVVEIPLMARYRCSNVRVQQSSVSGPLHSFKLFDPLLSAGKRTAGTSLVSTGKRILRRISSLSDVIPAFSSIGSSSHSKPRWREVIKFGCEDIDSAEKMRDEIDSLLWNCPLTLNSNQIKSPPSPTTTTTTTQIQQQDDVFVKVNEEIRCDIASDGGRSIDCRTRVYVNCGANHSADPIEIGLNFPERCGREVVRREEILPLGKELWMTNVRWTQLPRNGLVDEQDFADARLLKFRPVDSCRFEIMRFSSDLPENVQLALNVKCTCTTNVSVSAGIPQYCTIRLDVIVTDVKEVYGVIARIPISERYTHLFSHKSAMVTSTINSTPIQRSASSTRTKSDFISRILTRSSSISSLLDRRQHFSAEQSSGAGISLPAYYFQKTAGRVRFDQNSRSIVWRLGGLPKRGEGPYKPNTLVVGLSEPNIRFEEDFNCVHIQCNVKKKCIGTNCQVRSVAVQRNSTCRPHAILKTIMKYTIEPSKQVLTVDGADAKVDDPPKNNQLLLIGSDKELDSGGSSSSDCEDSDKELNLMGDGDSD